MDDNTRADGVTPEGQPPGQPPQPPAAPSASAETGAPGSGPRRTGRIALIASVLLVAAVIVAYAGWMLYGAMTTRMEAARQLDEATRLLQQADEVVLDIDEVVRAEIDEEIGERAEELRAEVPGAVENLQRAVSLIEEAIPDLRDDERDRAAATRESAQARLDMLAEADVILEANVKAAAALGPAERAWELVLEAETISEEAITKYNELTRDSVTESTRLSSQAETMVVEARQLFSEVATAFPEADLSLYMTYTEGKLALLKISKEGNQLWLDGKPAEANRASERYNTEEQKVIAVAERLPDSPARVIADAYEAVAGGPTQRYFNARDRASAADERLKRL